MVSISHQDKAPELAAALKEAALSPVASSRGMSLADVAQTVAALEESLGWATFNLVERLEKDGWATFWDIYYWDYYWDDYLGYIYIYSIIFLFFFYFLLLCEICGHGFFDRFGKGRPALGDLFFPRTYTFAVPVFWIWLCPVGFFFVVPRGGGSPATRILLEESVGLLRAAYVLNELENVTGLVLAVEET